MNGLHYPFTPQQQEILRWMATGMELQIIAHMIGTTPGMVRLQAHRMREALSCNSLQLVVFAVRWADVKEKANGQAVHV